MPRFEVGQCPVSKSRKTYLDTVISVIWHEISWIQYFTGFNGITGPEWAWCCQHWFYTGSIRVHYVIFNWHSGTVCVVLGAINLMAVGTCTHYLAVDIFRKTYMCSTDVMFHIYRCFTSLAEFMKLKLIKVITLTKSWNLDDWPIIPCYQTEIWLINLHHSNTSHLLATMILCNQFPTSRVSAIFCRTKL